MPGRSIAKPKGASKGDAVPRRRTQEERSEQTKQLILETSARLIRERGVAGLRTAEVAEAAGVSQGAQFHHFPTKEALIVATVKHVNSRVLLLAQKHASALDGKTNPVRAIIEDAADFFMGDYFFMEISLGLGGTRHEAYMPAVIAGTKEVRLQVERLWKRRLCDLGLSGTVASRVVDLTFNMVRGLAVRTLLDADRSHFDALYDVWIDMIDLYIERTGKAA